MQELQNRLFELGFIFDGGNYMQINYRHKDNGLYLIITSEKDTYNIYTGYENDSSCDLLATF